MPGALTSIDTLNQAELPLDSAEPIVASRSVPLHELLAQYRDNAERQLNGVRAVVLVLLASAALAYAPELTSALRLVNVSILVPMLAWTLGQYLLWRRRSRVPPWLTIANPVVDITAVTASMAGYAFAGSAALAVRAPMFLAYFVILAARPVTSSTRRAVAVVSLAVGEYVALLIVFALMHRMSFTASPLTAVTSTGVFPLDEGAKVLLLAVAGAVAIYATAWQERLIVDYSRASHDRDQLETRLARAQLESLKHQLRPHFLFNALNAITALIPIDPPAAQRSVQGLGTLLRESVTNSSEHEVRLGRELELLEHYLYIQRIRFQERLSVDVVVEPGVDGALVPNLLLQPLVENAIRHGIGPRASGGAIEVRVGRQGPRLRLQVSDDGLGADTGADGSVGREGVGLGNTRARLRHLYGDRQRMAITTTPGAGFAVEIELPFHQ